MYIIKTLVILFSVVYFTTNFASIVGYYAAVRLLEGGARRTTIGIGYVYRLGVDTRHARHIIHYIN